MDFPCPTEGLIFTRQHIFTLSLVAYKVPFSARTNSLTQAFTDRPRNTLFTNICFYRNAPILLPSCFLWMQILNSHRTCFYMHLRQGLFLVLWKSEKQLRGYNLSKPPLRLAGDATITVWPPLSVRISSWALSSASPTPIPPGPNPGRPGTEE